MTLTALSTREIAVGVLPSVVGDCVKTTRYLDLRASELETSLQAWELKALGIRAFFVKLGGFVEGGGGGGAKSTRTCP